MDESLRNYIVQKPNIKKHMLCYFSYMLFKKKIKIIYINRNQPIIAWVGVRVGEGINWKEPKGTFWDDGEMSFVFIEVLVTQMFTLVQLIKLYT